jgi:hypothetical protein
MTKRRGLRISNKAEMDALMAMESSLFYVTFLGDAVVLKNQITFNKSQAEKCYVMALNQAVAMMNSAKSLRQKIEASTAFMSVQILQLRIH